MPNPYIPDDEDERLNYFNPDDENNPSAPPPVIPPSAPPSAPNGLPPVAPGGNGGSPPVNPMGVWGDASGHPVDSQLPAPGPVEGGVDTSGLDAARSARASMTPPPIEKPKWWQRVLAGAEGAAAGYVNASGHRGVYVDPAAAEHNTLFGGQDLKQAQYAQQTGAADQRIAQEQGKVDTGIKVQGAAALDEQRKAMAEYRKSEAARQGQIDDEKKAVVSERAHEAFLRSLGPGSVQIKSGEQIPKGYSVVQDPNDPTVSYARRSGFLPMPPELAELLPGRQPNELISLDDMNQATTAKRAMMMEQAKVGAKPLTPEQIAAKAVGAPDDPAKWTPDITQKVEQEITKQKQAGMKVTVNNGGAPGLSEDAAQFMAESALSGLPPQGLTRNRVDQEKVFNSISKLAKSRGINGAEYSKIIAIYKGNTAAFGQLQKNWQGIQAFEKTANANGDLAQQLSGKVARTGSPLLNEWIQGGQSKILGDPDLGSFDAAVKTFTSEYAKIMSGSTNGSTPSSDAANRKAESLLRTSHSVAEFNSRLGTLRQEMGNRLSGIKQTRDELLSNFGGNQQGGQGAPQGGGQVVSEKALRQHGASMGMTPAQIENELQQAKKQPGIQWVP